MTIELIREYWALLAASVLAVALLLFVGSRVWQDSAGGRLRAARRDYERCRRARWVGQRRAETRARKLAGLRERADDISPRRIDDASEDYEDARALLKIADDQVLVAAARLRSIIVSEYPPRRHDALRRRYLGEDGPI